MNHRTSPQSSSAGLGMFYGTWIAAVLVSQLVRLNFSDKIIYNPGLAFNIILPKWLIIAAVALFLILIVVWYFRLAAKDTVISLAFGLLLGGGVSNLFERLLFNGNVADYWGCFGITTINLADIFIFSGIILIVIKFLYAHGSR